MSDNITPEDEARYAALSDRMEAGDYRLSPEAAAAASFTDYSDELDALIGELDLIESDEPTPAAPEGAVTTAQVRRALGRPSLSGAVGKGRSHRRQTRLPDDLNARLDSEIVATRRKESEILREALVLYFERNDRPANGRKKRTERSISA